MMRIPAQDGKLMHAAVQINGAIGDASTRSRMERAFAGNAQGLAGHDPSLRRRRDAFIAHAVEAGATIKMPAADMFWGDRYGVITDPFGHSWSIATPQREVSAEELQDAVKNMPTATAARPAKRLTPATPDRSIRTPVPLSPLAG